MAKRVALQLLQVNAVLRCQRPALWQVHLPVQHVHPRDAECGGNPDGRGGGQPDDVSSLRVEDHAATDEPNAGDDALNHTRRRVSMNAFVGGAEDGRGKHGERGAERNEGVCPEPGWFLRELAVEPDGPLNDLAMMVMAFQWSPMRSRPELPGFLTLAVVCMSGS